MSARLLSNDAGTGVENITNAKTFNAKKLVFQRVVQEGEPGGTQSLQIDNDAIKVFNIDSGELSIEPLMTINKSDLAGVRSMKEIKESIELPQGCQAAQVSKGKKKTAAEDGDLSFDHCKKHNEKPCKIDTACKWVDAPTAADQDAMQQWDKSEKRLPTTRFFALLGKNGAVLEKGNGNDRKSVLFTAENVETVKKTAEIINALIPDKVKEVKEAPTTDSTKEAGKVFVSPAFTGAPSLSVPSSSGDGG